MGAFNLWTVFIDRFCGNFEKVSKKIYKMVVLGAIWVSTE